MILNTNTQKIEFLVFLIDSKNMKISLTNKKAEHLTLKIKKYLVEKLPNIWQLASIMGQSGKMHYWKIEREKDSFLKKQSRNFEATIALNQHILTELKWYLDTIPKVASDTHTPTNCKTNHINYPELANLGKDASI